MNATACFVQWSAIGGGGAGSYRLKSVAHGAPPRRAHHAKPSPCPRKREGICSVERDKKEVNGVKRRKSK
jgi:hypothetical protein